MLLNLDKLEEGCPKGIKEEMGEIKILSKKFIGFVDILPNQVLGEVKIEVQSAKNTLFQIFSRFLTLLSNLLEEETELKKIGLKLKFEEDIGSVIQELKEKNTGKIEHQIGITSLLKFAGELQTAYDFLIYHPIITANKDKKEDAKEYMGSLFKTLRANASILGYAGKFTLQPSKQILPRPISMITSKFIKEKPEVEETQEELSELGEESEEEDEND